MLLKFAYDGTKFYGYQRQKNLPTIEGKILKLLRKYNISKTLKSASRTDKGVSALGNVILINTELEVRDIIGILNSNLQWIYFHSYSEESMNPRFADMRWYRYHLYDFGFDIRRLEQSARIFEGTHDFKNFTRARDNTIIRIDKIEVKKIDDIIIIDFFARNYLWNLIRRIVSAMEKFSLGLEFGEEVFEENLNFGLASPEPLILMDIRYKTVNFKTLPIKKKIMNIFAKRYISSFVYKYLLNLGKL